MDITKAFADLHKAADADPKQVREGRRRRDLFRAAFCPEEEVDDVVPSGSLERRTRRDPINDVDVIIVYSRKITTRTGASRVRAPPRRSAIRQAGFARCSVLLMGRSRRRSGSLVPATTPSSASSTTPTTPTLSRSTPCRRCA